MEQINEQFVTPADEELLSKFFKEQRVDISDDGFTRRVMNHLPKCSLWLNRIWTVVCVAIAIVFGVMTRAWQSVMGTLQGLLADVLTSNFFTMSPLSTVYLLLVGLAVIGSLGLLSKERELAF